MGMSMSSRCLLSAELGIVYENAGVCRDQREAMGKWVCEHRCLMRAEEGSGHVSACPCREQRRAVGMCMQVPVEEK